MLIRIQRYKSSRQRQREGVESVDPNRYADQIDHPVQGKTHQCRFALSVVLIVPADGIRSLALPPILGSNRLHQTPLFFLPPAVETAVVYRRRNNINEEIGHQGAHEVHHQGNRQIRTQYTEDRRHNHKADVEVAKSSILHLLVKEFDKPSSAHLQSAWEHRNPPEQIRRLHNENGNLSQVTVDQSLLALAALHGKSPQYSNRLIEQKAKQIGKAHIPDIVLLISVRFDESHHHRMNSKGQGASASQIADIRRNPIDLIRINLPISRRLDKLIHHKHEVQHRRVGPIPRQFHHQIQVLNKHHPHHRQEDNQRQPLLTERVEHTLVLEGDQIRSAVAVEEEEDYRVELVNYQVDVYHTEQNQIEASNQPKESLPFPTQNATDGPFHVPVRVAHVQDVDAAGHEGDQTRKQQHDR